ncbi:MAG: hypothetical protein PSX81_01155 [bacterium]|nr:hypothetical protein [bacterium]
MNKISFCGIFVLTLLSFTACKKDKPSTANTIFNSNASGVFISNEGTFQFGNADLGFYNPNDQSYADELFKSANKRPLGDICQSFYFINNKLYIVVNNSDKIEIVNPNSFASIGTITGLGSPRYFLPVSIQKAYVTDYNSNSISVIDLNTNKVTNKIKCQGWTEELYLTHGKVYVCNKSSRYLYIINPSNDQIQDSIKIGYGANSIKLDKFDRLWVLANGDNNTELATLQTINTNSDSVITTFTFKNKDEQPWRLKINGSNDTLYYLNSGLYQLPISANQLNSTPLIPENKTIFYGLGIDPSASTIYVSDAIDFVQKGVVYRYQPNGILINSFKAGISPNDFYFKP